MSPGLIIFVCLSISFLLFGFLLFLAAAFHNFASPTFDFCFSAFWWLFSGTCWCGSSFAFHIICRLYFSICWSCGWVCRLNLACHYSLFSCLRYYGIGLLALLQTLTTI